MWMFRPISQCLNPKSMEKQDKKEEDHEPNSMRGAQIKLRRTS